MAWMYLVPYSWHAEDTTNNAMGATMMGTVGEEIYTMLAKETATMMGLVFMHKAWLHGQVMMLPEEKQEMFMEKKGKKGDDHMMTRRRSSACALSTASER